MKLKLWLNSILEKKNDLLNQVQCTEVHWNNSERDNKITIKAYYCIKFKVKVKSDWKEYTRKELLNLIYMQESEHSLKHCILEMDGSTGAIQALGSSKRFVEDIKSPNLSRNWSFQNNQSE